MLMNTKIKNIIGLSKISPVLVVDLEDTLFGASTIIDGKIPSKDLGIVNGVDGLKIPLWFNKVVKSDGNHQIIIKEIDSIDKENQEKFYELLKYKAISDIELPKNCNIIVTAKNLKNVSETIIRLCQIVI